MMFLLEGGNGPPREIICCYASSIAPGAILSTAAIAGASAAGSLFRRRPKVRCEPSGQGGSGGRTCSLNSRSHTDWVTDWYGA